jgi:predicted transcriptional regulator
MDDDRRLYTVAEAAKVLGVTARTVRDWLRQGKVKGEKTVLVPFAKNPDLFRREWRIAEGDLGRPVRKDMIEGALGKAVLAFMHLTKTPTVELAWKCSLCVATILKLRKGRMPNPLTQRKIFEAYPEAVESFMGREDAVD